MPQEDRRIIFSYEETYKAIYGLCVQKDMKKPPPGNIEDIDEKGSENSKLTFKISNKQENTIDEIDYSSDFLAAALMLLCRSLSIPVSRKAQKFVELQGDKVILRMTM